MLLGRIIGGWLKGFQPSTLRQGRFWGGSNDEILSSLLSLGEFFCAAEPLLHPLLHSVHPEILDDHVLRSLLGSGWVRLLYGPPVTSLFSDEWQPRGEWWWSSFLSSLFLPCVLIVTASAIFFFFFWFYRRWCNLSRPFFFSLKCTGPGLDPLYNPNPGRPKPASGVGI